MPKRFFARPRRRSRTPAGETFRWGASSSLTAPLTISAGGPAQFDLTPGAPSAWWQNGTTEPLLLRIRGVIVPFVQSAVAVTQGGVREQRFAAVALSWRHAGAAILDPMVTLDMSSEDVLWHGLLALDTRDFVVPAGAAPANPAFVNIAGPGRTDLLVDVKARRRVRGEDDRLMLSARFGEYFSQSTPPQGPTFADVGGRLGWMLRFLYRTHR